MMPHCSLVASHLRCQPSATSHIYCVEYAMLLVVLAAGCCLPDTEPEHHHDNAQLYHSSPLLRRHCGDDAQGRHERALGAILGLGDSYAKKLEEGCHDARLQQLLGKFNSSVEHIQKTMGQRQQQQQQQQQ